MQLIPKLAWISSNQTVSSRGRRSLFWIDIKFSWWCIHILRTSRIMYMNKQQNGTYLRHWQTPLLHRPPAFPMLRQLAAQAESPTTPLMDKRSQVTRRKRRWLSWLSTSSSLKSSAPWLNSKSSNPSIFNINVFLYFFYQRKDILYCRQEKMSIAFT